MQMNNSVSLWWVICPFFTLSVFLYHIINQRLANPKKNTSNASLASTSEVCWRLLCSCCWSHASRLLDFSVQFLDFSAAPINTICFTEVFHSSSFHRGATLANPTKSTSNASLVSAREVCCCLVCSFCWSLDFSAKSVKTPCFIEVLNSSSLRGRAALRFPAKAYILLASQLRYVLSLAENNEPMTTGSHVRPHDQKFDPLCPRRTALQSHTHIVHDQAGDQEFTEPPHSSSLRRVATLVNPTNSTSNASLVPASEVCYCLLGSFRWSPDFSAKSGETHCFIEVLGSSSSSSRAAFGFQANVHTLWASHFRYVLPLAGNKEPMTTGSHVRPHDQKFDPLCPLNTVLQSHTHTVHDQAENQEFTESPHSSSCRGTTVNPTKSTSNASLVSASEVCCCLLGSFRWSLDFSPKSGETHCSIEVPNSSSRCRRAALGLQAKVYILLASHLQYVPSLAGNNEPLATGSHLRPRDQKVDLLCPQRTVLQSHTHTVHDEADDQDSIEFLFPNLFRRDATLVNPTKSTSTASLVPASEVCYCLFDSFRWSLDSSAKSDKTHCFIEVLDSSSLRSEAAPVFQAKVYILLASHLRYVLPLAGNKEPLTTGSQLRPHDQKFDPLCPQRAVLQRHTHTVHDQADDQEFTGFLHSSSFRRGPALVNPAKSTSTASLVSASEVCHCLFDSFRWSLDFSAKSDKTHCFIEVLDSSSFRSGAAPVFQAKVHILLASHLRYVLPLAGNKEPLTTGSHLRPHDQQFDPLCPQRAVLQRHTHTVHDPADDQEFTGFLHSSSFCRGPTLVNPAKSTSNASLVSASEVCCFLLCSPLWSLDFSTKSDKTHCFTEVLNSRSLRSRATLGFLAKVYIILASYLRYVLPLTGNTKNLWPQVVI